MKLYIKKIFGVFIAIVAIMLNYSEPVKKYANIPSEIVINYGQDLSLDFGLPVKYTIRDDKNEDIISVDTNKQILGNTKAENLTSPQNQEVSIEYSAFGIFPTKYIKVISVMSHHVILGGQSIGITLECEGVLVVGYSEIITDDLKTAMPAKTAGIKSGDFITKVDDEIVEGAAHLSHIIKQSKGQSLSVTIRRGNALMLYDVVPAKDRQDDQYHLGIWGRDSSSGIGTMTFTDPNTLEFGALGHSVSDADTGEILVIKDGIVFTSRITQIIKGNPGQPGELKGEFILGLNEIGILDNNCSFGLFGKLNTLEYIDTSRTIKAAQINEIEVGPAQIFTTLDSDGIKAYDCKVKKIDINSISTNKNMIIQITDDELLEKTGGIVQGMSGSPIVQNGKLIGAVTHVFINDPTSGHAVFITSMLEQ